MEVHWLLSDDVIKYNRETILENTPHEPIGVRDHGALESALKRGAQLHYYDQTSDMFDLAAAVGSGLIYNHPFHNANKRTAFISTTALLLMNGYWLSVEHQEAVAMYLGIAVHTRTETCLANWLRKNSFESEYK